MNTIGTIICAAIAAAVATAIAHFIDVNFLANPIALFALILLPALITGLLARRNNPIAAGSAKEQERDRSSNQGSKQNNKAQSGKKPRPAKTRRSGGNREQGSVKWFNAGKGYGFISRADGSEVFVHFRSIEGEGRRSLRDGQKVEFSVSEGDKGLQADDVSVI